MELRNAALVAMKGRDPRRSMLIDTGSPNCLPSLLPDAFPLQKGHWTAANTDRFYLLPKPLKS